MKRKVLAVVTILVLLPVFLWSYYHFDPSKGILFPKCPVFLIFGIPCPGCGTQRALHSMLHLDFAQALKFNALAVFLIPVLAVLSIAAALREKHPRFYQITHNGYFGYALVVIIFLWWISRILFKWYV